MSQPHLYQYSKDWVKKRYPFEYTDELEQYFSHLFRGDIRLWNQWNPLDESFNFRVHQIVYKLFKANHLVELLERNFRLRACGLVRHPLAVVNSTAEREWPEEAAPYLKSSLIRARLPDEALAVSERIYREGTYQSRLLVEWFLKNYWLFEQRSYPVVSYEDIVSYPFDASGWLCHYLNLGDQRTMSDVVESPTKTTTTPSAKDIREEGPSVRIGAWQHCLDTALIKQCRRLLEAYSIRRYRSDTVYPADGRLVTDQPGECDET